jgi:hypothetical protein
MDAWSPKGAIEYWIQDVYYKSSKILFSGLSLISLQAIVQQHFHGIF